MLPPRFGPQGDLQGGLQGGHTLRHDELLLGYRGRAFVRVPLEAGLVQEPVCWPPALWQGRLQAQGRGLVLWQGRLHAQGRRLVLLQGRLQAQAQGRSLEPALELAPDRTYEAEYK